MAEAAVEAAAVEREVAPKVQVQRRSLACLQRLCVENGGHRVQGKAECDALRAEVEAQAAKVRATKARLQTATEEDKQELWAEVQRLLQLKYDAALFLGATAGPAKMVRGDDLFTELKLRWRVRGADGRVVRLQRPVQCRHSLAAHEVRRLVAAHTAARLPGVGAVVAVAARADLLGVALWGPGSVTPGGAAAALRVLGDADVLSAPLVLPGPCLANTTVVDLAVTFAPGAWDATVVPAPVVDAEKAETGEKEDEMEDEQQDEQEEEQEQRTRRRRCRLNAEQIAALLGPGQSAFVWDGCVYACAPGIADALTALRDTQSDTLARALQDLVAAHTATLVHDPAARRNSRGSHRARGVRRRGGRRAH